MVLVVRIVLAKTDLLSLIMIKVVGINPHVLRVLLVPVYWLEVCWVAKGVLLELLSMYAVDYLGLLLSATEHGRKLLAVITEVVLHGIHILLELK